MDIFAAIRTERRKVLAMMLLHLRGKKEHRKMERATRLSEEGA